MIEGRSKFESIINALDDSADVVAAYSDVKRSYKGQTGMYVSKTYVHVMNAHPTEISFEDFKTELLKNEEGMVNLNRMNGELKGVGTRGNHTSVIAIEMHPGISAATAAIEQV